MNHLYRLMEPPPTEQPLDCPVCGSGAMVYEYVESEGTSVQRVVMCERGDLPPRDTLKESGCLLFMPPDDFYHGRGADAVKYWNEHARAVLAIRKENAIYRGSTE